MADKTGNTYIPGTMTDKIDISTANRASSIKVCPSYFDYDRHAEIELYLFWR